MVVSKLKYKNGKVLNCQRVQILCDKCRSEFTQYLHSLLRCKQDPFKYWECRNCRSNLPANKEYHGVEILSELRRNKQGSIISSQRIDVKCFSCNCITNVNYYSHKANAFKQLEQQEKYEYKCHRCSASENRIKHNKSLTGKNVEEIYGKLKGNQIRKIHRIQAINRLPDNPLIKRSKEIKGKTYEEIYGIERSKEIKAKQSAKLKGKPGKFGKDNPQFGKPAHRLSGKGSKGYYGKIFFRSILELSFIINVLEKHNIKWESGERKKHKIAYIIESRNRNYFPDFITETEIIEVKPYTLRNTIINLAKQKYGIEYAKKQDKIYRMYTEKDFQRLSQIEIDILVNNKKVKFL